MVMFHSLAESGDPDSVSVPVITYGMRVEDDVFLDAHAHRKAQLMLQIRGVLSCEAEGGLWVVPQQTAFWIPGGVLHTIKTVGASEAYCVLMEPEIARTMPSRCACLVVTPLLRELIIRSADFPLAYADDGQEARLVRVLLDELTRATPSKLHLPMPTDRRLRAIADRMMDTPADWATVDEWARRVGMSVRSLSRLFVRETGLSFGEWRRRLHIMLALRWLSKGLSVQAVSLDLGYESAGSFVTMFRKALGAPPARYIAQGQAPESAPTSLSSAGSEALSPVKLTQTFVQRAIE